MRAYLSFILVLLSLVLLFSLLSLDMRASGSKAILVERTYSISMNVKEIVLESLRQGAQEGFRGYDAAHDVEMCIHCPICTPRTCDPMKCQKCFSEHEARDQARQGAQAKLASLGAHAFDPDFDISVGEAEVDVFTRAEPLSKNGFALDSLKVSHDIRISLDSEKLGIEGQAEIPGGLMIYAGNS